MKPTNHNSRSGISEVRRQHCRSEAHKLLATLWVQAPEEIDLETLAYKAGNLRIEEGGLEFAEGRIVATKSGGTIRVKQGLNPGRRRFTIAHEIGHRILHKREGLSHEDSAANFTLWNDSSEETEANMFAAELLMPGFLIEPRTSKEDPSLAFIDELAAEFSTSVMSTAVQYVNYTAEPVALVVSQKGLIKWSKRSKNFWPEVRTEKVSGDSAAGEIHAKKSGDTNKMVDTPAYAWLPQLERSGKDIKEDSRLLDWYNCTITLLWLDGDLDE